MQVTLNIQNGHKFSGKCFVMFLLPLAIIIHAANGFNVDVRSHVAYSRPEGTMFGFAVTAHREGDTGWVIVGAPEDDSEQHRVGIDKAGAVYRCQTVMPYRCQQIPFDTSGNNNASGSQIDDKSGQWFGASVHSSGQDGIIVACAPRYVYFSINKKRREPVGTCFTATDAFSKFSEYSPCRTAAWGYHKQGYCQAGFASAVTQDRLYIGSVGSWYWQGQVFSQNLRNRLDLASSEAGPDSEDNSYLGYSLALGDFTGNGGGADLAVGMPRAANLTGKVVFLTGRRFLQLHNLTGTQVGAYFGYSLAVLDMNGDGLDDVVIGAPLHTDLDKASNQYETGRIYVVYQNSEHKFRRWDIRDGREVGARLGLSLSRLGDLDQDGYEDLATGAPYSGREQEGAIFIFRGGPKGIDDYPSQTIFARNVDPKLRGFGFSLSGGVDLDGNGYPDLIVGAPDSGHALYFKSRPVVRVTASVELETDNGKIDPENRTCTLHSKSKSKTMVSCLSLKGCLVYEGAGVTEELEFSVVFKLDARKQVPRMYFLAEEGHELEIGLRLQKNKTLCKRSFVYLSPSFRDKLSPLEVQMRYDIKLSSQDSKETGGTLMPIIDPKQNLRAVSDAATIHKECGKDNICIPNLKVSHNISSERYLIGSDQRLELMVDVTNEGEDAYEANLFITMPPNVDYSKTEMVSATNGSDMANVLCSPVKLDLGSVLKCELGNPMLSFSRISLKTFWKPIVVGSNTTPIEFNYKVNSSNPELTTSLEDNHAQITIPFIVETDIVIRGSSDPEPLRHNISAYEEIDLNNRPGDLHENDIGPEVIHVYQIENKGPSDILQAQAYILWPSFRPNGDPLLYLASQPIIDGPAKCAFVSEVNPYEIKIDRHARAHSFNNLDRGKRAIDRPLPDLGTTSTQRPGFGDSDCGPTRCTYISCTLGPLKKKEYVVFRIRSRLWTTSVAKLPHHEYDIRSRIYARITQLPHGVDPNYLDVQSFTVTTKVSSIHGDYLDGPSIPIWILLLAILAGLFFLALVSFILWHFGFFTRRRHQDSLSAYAQAGTIHEKQPLAVSSHVARPSTVQSSFFANGTSSTPHQNGYSHHNGNGHSNGNGHGLIHHRATLSRTPLRNGRLSTNSGQYPDLQPGDVVL